MNLTSYAQVLEQAKSQAVNYKEARVVIYRPYKDEFKDYSLSVHTLNENPEFQELIVASVDHAGFIMESLWIKAKLQEVAA